MSTPAARAEAARLRAELDRPDLIPDADLEAVAKAETPVVIGWEYLPPLEGKPRRRAIWSRPAAEAWASRRYAPARLEVLEGGAT